MSVFSRSEGHCLLHVSAEENALCQAAYDGVSYPIVTVLGPNGTIRVRNAGGIGINVAQAVRDCGLPLVDHLGEVVTTKGTGGDLVALCELLTQRVEKALNNLPE